MSNFQHTCESETNLNLSAQQPCSEENDVNDPFNELLNGVRLQYEEKNKKVKNLCAELKTAQEELAAKSKEVDEQKKAALDLKANIDEAVLKITSLTTELDNARESSGKYHRMVQISQNTIGEIKEAYNTKIDEFNVETKRQMTIIYNLESTITELKSILVCQQNYIANMEKAMTDAGNAFQEVITSNRDLEKLEMGRTTLPKSSMPMHTIDSEDLKSMSSSPTSHTDNIPSTSSSAVPDSDTMGNITVGSTRKVYKRKRGLKRKGSTRSKKPIIEKPNDDMKIFDVDWICGHRISGGKTKYNIKWVGYEEDQNTWETEDNIFCKDLIVQYETSHKKCQDIISKAKANGEFGSYDKWVKTIDECTAVILSG